MSIDDRAQTNLPPAAGALRIGVDVGGTFTDLVASDGTALVALKLPSTPSAYQQAVIDAVTEAAGGRTANVIHGSTVATNALLERRGEPIAFVTTDGFADMLLIGRQNRPHLYALRVERPAPLALPEHCFTVRERVDSKGQVVEPLTDDEIERMVKAVKDSGLRHAAVCLLFSFIYPAHERAIARALEAAGVTVSLSCVVMPEFREYERASTTAINASLGPSVKAYLEALREGLPDSVTDLRIMQSGGGTLSPREATRSAAKMVLSGPAGGVIGAAFVAASAGFKDVISYDMGGTSTDVATILDGLPQWTTSTRIDGLPIGLPMFDIQTVGAGGGSIAAVDAGGALRVGPRSASAAPGPACYGRGGTEPTVTDANVVLGRIPATPLVTGAMTLDRSLAHRAIEPLARSIGRSVTATALGIVRVAESNMEHAIRVVTSRRGHDPRSFTLVSFGGAGGLHACALADSLEIRRILVPPYCGVLSALGMVVAPPIVDASRTVVHLGDQLDSDRLAAEFGGLTGETIDAISYEQTASIEVYADVRFRGQSHELKVRVFSPRLDHIRDRFVAAYENAYGRAPEGREIEVVTIRIRRIGKVPAIRFPEMEPEFGKRSVFSDLVDAQGDLRPVRCLTRAELLAAGSEGGPFVLVDAHATTYVPAGWRGTATRDGSVILARTEAKRCDNEQGGGRADAAATF